MIFKTLKDKCLYYRDLTDYKLMPNSNILVMLDGRGFSKLIKNNFKKPFDDAFIDIMNRTAKFLCENIQGCKIAYTQSDEISLYISDSPDSDVFFGGRLCKLQSLIASMATGEFNRWFTIWNLNNCKDNVNVGEFISNAKMAQFDCKVWTVPNKNDLFAWFLYRQNDCIKNSKQQTAQTYIPHKELLGKNADEQIAMCNDRCIVDWNLFEDKYKYGRFVYLVEKEGEATTPDGEVVKYLRNSFEVSPAFKLQDDKEKFFEIIK